MNTCSDDLKIKEEEFEVAQRVLLNKDNIEKSSLYRNSLQRLEELKELNLSGVFICVGCGPLPSTLIFAKKNFLLKKLIGIDIDPEALLFAKKIISQLFDESIELRTDLKGLETQEKSEVLNFFIANMVRPKKEVLKTVWSLASPQSVVIVREPETETTSSWDHISNSINPLEWNIKKIFPASPHFGSRSIVLSKATSK